MGNVDLLYRNTIFALPFCNDLVFQKSILFKWHDCSIGLTSFQLIIPPKVRQWKRLQQVQHLKEGENQTELRLFNVDSIKSGVFFEPICQRGFFHRKTYETSITCIFKSITPSSLIHPYLPFENQVPCVQKGTVDLQTNLMNNPAELLFKLDSSDCQIYGGELEFRLKGVLWGEIGHSRNSDCGPEGPAEGRDMTDD